MYACILNAFIFTHHRQIYESSETYDKMVKRTIEWQTCEALSSASQVNEYIESCKEWLLSTSDLADDEVELSTQAMPNNIVTHKIPNIGLIREHINSEHTFDCFICSETKRVHEGKVVNANPFTRAQCMLVCNACNHLSN